MPEEPEQCETECPYCHKPVAYKWQKGFIAEPHNVLIADSVWHGECWDEQVRRDIPGEVLDKLASPTRRSILLQPRRGGEK